jgi:hypothetical protein
MLELEMNDKAAYPDPLEAALEAIIATAGPEYSDQLIAAKCRGLMRGYHARWQNSGYDTESVESFVTHNIYNFDAKRESRSRTFYMAGKIDLIARHDGQRTLIDHKTTSEDIANPDDPYWRQLVVEAQPSHYMLLEWLNGRKCDGAVWDVVRKPMISPKKLSKKDAADVIESGFYCGAALTESQLDFYSANAEGRETLTMYEIRLAHDCSTVRPEYYFQRRPIPRLDEEIREYAGELWEHSQEILHARRTGRHARNSGACMLYKRPCKFLGICSGHDEPESENWRRKKQVHAELPVTDGDGRNLITNSRIRCFQTCRRKHFYQYELGIERVDDKPTEALYFGHIYHVGQEAYWLALQKGMTNGDSNTNDPVTEIGNADADSAAHAC